jgi:hypothetical protein
LALPAAQIARAGLLSTVRAPIQANLLRTSPLLPKFINSYVEKSFS